MNKEIKLMLNIIKDVSEHKEGSRNGLMLLSCKDYKTLLDYITNLQQIEQDHEQANAVLMQELTNLEIENERLKEWKKDLLNENIELENIRKEAIEYIEKHFEDDEGIICKITGKMECETNYNFLDNLLNILQNGSDDNE